jgi:4-carboxymuconolactone decarboxylase
VRRPFVDLRAHPEARRAAERISGERWGRISALYGMLLHSPPVAEGWVGLGSAVRRRTELDDRLRELAICLVARVCEQGYEWQNHAPIARDAGATEEELAALLDRGSCASYSELDRLVLDLTEATARGRVTDELVATASDRLGDRLLTEVIATAAYYVGTAHFLTAFGIGEGAPTFLSPDQELPS